MNNDRKKLLIDSALSYHEWIIDNASYNDERMLAEVVTGFGFSCTSCPCFDSCFDSSNKMGCIDTMSAWLRGDI